MSSLSHFYYQHPIYLLSLPLDFFLCLSSLSLSLSAIPYLLPLPPSSPVTVSLLPSPLLLSSSLPPSPPPLFFIFLSSPPPPHSLLSPPLYLVTLPLSLVTLPLSVATFERISFDIVGKHLALFQQNSRKLNTTTLYRNGLR